MKHVPTYLGKSGRKFWREVLNEFVLEDQHDLQRLAHAASCLDRIDAARQEIEKIGAYYVDRFGQPKEHPGQKTERDNKALFARLVREMGLGDFQPQETRIPR